MVRMCVRGVCWLALALSCVGGETATNRRKASSHYKTFPNRWSHEAAVVEWGHSAVISALDAAVAKFGAQTDRGAYFEVEAPPVLGDPLHGRVPLANAGEVAGNVLVLTSEAIDDGSATPVSLARVARDAGAAALMVVNIDADAPDYVYSMEPRNDDERHFAELHIDFPVIMLSLSSGNVLTTASIPPDSTEQHDAPNNGMPDRVRLYAAGHDRPFFEDVTSHSPVIYLIHNLLTHDECQHLLSLADSHFARNNYTYVDDTVPNLLENTVAASDNVPKAIHVQRTVLWNGRVFFDSQMKERIEQVTGYPQQLYSDWQIDRYEGDGISRWELHYDTHPIHTLVATITVFLNDVQGGEMVFPKTTTGNNNRKKTIMIRPRKGMAVVHHTTDERGRLDDAAQYEERSTNENTRYIARMFVYAAPRPIARTIVLPLVAHLWRPRGRIPRWIISVHDLFLRRFGSERGTVYFDGLCVLLPIILVLSFVLGIGTILYKLWFPTTTIPSSGRNDSSSPNKNVASSSDDKTTKKKRRVTKKMD